jgi:hypothetical protein
MSVLARALALISALLVAAAAGAFIWLLWVRPSFDVTTEMFQLAADMSATDSGRWIATGAASALIVYALSSILATTWPRQRLIELRAGDHESVRISPSALERQLEDIVRGAGQVRDARVEVHREGDRSVALDLSVAIPPQSEVASVVADIQRRLATSLAAQYGISMTKKPKIEVRYTDREERPRRHRRLLRREDHDAAVVRSDPEAQQGR